jgi:hypothetical protein
VFTSPHHANPHDPLTRQNFEQRQTGLLPHSPARTKKILSRSSSRCAAAGRLLLAEMIVLGGNILIRAVLGKRVRQLFETYVNRGVRFYAPEMLTGLSTRT